MNDGDIDYLKELNILSNYSSLTEDDNSMNNDDVCLISLETLSDNCITLKCGHKFNYMAIFNYFLYKNVNCPYCSSINYGRLPIRRVNGKYVIEKNINLPLKLCINDEHKCKTCSSTQAFNGACIRCHRYVAKMLEDADEETTAMVEKLILETDNKMKNALVKFVKNYYVDMFDDYILGALTKKYLLMLCRKYYLDVDVDVKKLTRYEIISFLKLV